MIVQEFIFVSLLCFLGSASKPTNTKTLVKKYELKANESKTMETDDRRLLTNWTDEYQVKRLDVSVKYRIEMVRHEESSFKSDGNTKWMNCLYIHRKEIRRSKRFYHTNELECLRTITSKDAEGKEEVEQLEKQIMKWRKGYRYLIKHCDLENPGDEKGARLCLVELMQNDNYDEVLERLMILKQSAMNTLYEYYNSSVIDLEECLKSQLSRYLDRVRHIMDNLNKCYKMY